jgi:hypothetical protein
MSEMILGGVMIDQQVYQPRRPPQVESSLEAVATAHLIRLRAGG